MKKRISFYLLSIAIVNLCISISRKLTNSVISIILIWIGIILCFGICIYAGRKFNVEEDKVKVKNPSIQKTYLISFVIVSTILVALLIWEIILRFN
ncbi:hypothetical protein [Acholeplasma palmae]|uniref:hypothetical protein n=1 Tax=Acholeplasma palmae TaxID=38986 RepID=UPI0005FA2EE0|nr:hypothetical protein [Alteracholeplasma palmae]